MLINILVLLVLLVAAYAISKAEKEAIENWLDNDPTYTKEDFSRFWIGVLSKPSRAAAIAVVLICQPGWISMLAAILLTVIVTYYLAQNELLVIDWFEANNHKRASAVCYALAANSLINTVGVFNIIWTIVEVVAVIVIIMLIVMVIQKSKGNAGSDDRYEDDDDDTDDTDGNDDDDDGDDGDDHGGDLDDPFAFDDDL